MFQKIFITLLIILLNSSSGYSQFKYKPTKLLQFAQNINMNDNSASISLTGRHLKMLIFSGAMAHFMLGFDKTIEEEYVLEGNSQPIFMVKRFGEIGNLYDQRESYIAMIGLSAAALGYGLLYDDRKSVNTVKLMFKSWLTTSLITSAMKVTFGRYRPYMNHGSHKFNFLRFSLNSSRMSFPSGHTSSIFSLVTVLAEQYDYPWVKVPAYGFATSVAFQRMLYRKHWASDVIVGGLIGYIVGHTLVKRHKSKYSIYPIFADNSFGIAFHF